MTQAEKAEAIKRAAVDFIKASEASTKAAFTRGSIEPSASRAKMTTGNAHWSRCAEHRDRMESRLRELCETF